MTKLSGKRIDKIEMDKQLKIDDKTIQNPKGGFRQLKKLTNAQIRRM